ncbi:MAG: N-acetylglucosamine-6-phosphate deacetylase [Atopostipes sp.]|nr:N-acetylglucosamine-6-phosphate deacetylase [Atopostipes sp.]
MSKIIINAEIYTGEEVIPSGFIRYDEEIQAVGSMEDYEAESDEEVTDAEGQKLVPGFIDIHSHGGYGSDNMDADSEAIDEMTTKMLREGITSYFATTMTQSDENIENALAAIKEAKAMNPMIQGIHLEGPFVSPAYKGAQPEQFMRPATAETMKRWNDISGGNIRLVTYAPETGDVSDFEQYCQDHDIVLSVGHSGAEYEELDGSAASHVTHLFNGQLGLHHRQPGVAGFGLLNDGINAEMIVDGFHIVPEMVDLAYRVRGADNIVLITDAMRAKGAPEGESELGGQKVFVKDKQARLENGSLAGSVLTYDDAFRNMIDFTGCSIEEAVKMSSGNQAKEFDLDQKGALKAGKDADIVLLDEDLRVKNTILAGASHPVE